MQSVLKIAAFADRKIKSCLNPLHGDHPVNSDAFIWSDLEGSILCVKCMYTCKMHDIYNPALVVQRKNENDVQLE